MKIKNQRGFSLVELLVVISIIGMLSTMAVVSLGGARKKSRDARRLTDIKQIRTALELYYNDNNEYPPSGGGTGAISDSNSKITESDPIKTVGGETYMLKMPQDPKSTQGYYYKRGTDNKTYVLHYVLETKANNSIAAGGHCATPASMTDESNTNCSSTDPTVLIGSY